MYENVCQCENPEPTEKGGLYKMCANCNKTIADDREPDEGWGQS